MAYCTADYLRSRLPQVGDLLVKSAVTGKQLSICTSKPRRCKVIYVNAEHLWYMVQFETGYREMYKLPEVPVYVSDQAHKPRKVCCTETDTVYDSIKEAAKATGCTANAIISVCRGERVAINGLHWRYVDEKTHR